MSKYTTKGLLFFFIFLMHTMYVSAQERFKLTGVVMEVSSKNRIAEAEILNKQTGYYVSSNNLGLFQLDAAVGDTLVVARRGFLDREIVIPSNKDIILYLSTGTNLNEVNIIGRSKKMELDGIKQDYRDKGVFYEGKPPLLSYLFTPLTALYELFGSEPKKARRFGKYYNTEMQQTKIDGFFNESLIQKHTGLQGKDLENFMLNYRPDYDKSKNWTEYDAIKYIKDTYQKYAATLKK